MKDLIPIPDSDLLHQLQDHWNQQEIRLPFQNEIYLLSTYVAGTMYVSGIGYLAARLEPGLDLRLVREPTNHYDKYAILVNNPEGEKLGYVPRAVNRVFARLMDAGKLLICRLKSVAIDETGITLKIRIYLKD